MLAAGNGRRAGNTIPKQFQLVKGVPLLFHTFNTFSQVNGVRFILVLNEKHVEYWNDLVLKYNLEIPHKIVHGGPTRFHSVKSSLNIIPDNEIVLIHDGVRPLVSDDTIQNVIALTIKKGNAIPVIDINESVRQVDGVYSKSVDRSKLKVVQTPQGFISGDLKKAYNCVYNEQFTDDATVYESWGGSICTVNGNQENIKVTSPKDLKIIETLLKD